MVDRSLPYKQFDCKILKKKKDAHGRLTRWINNFHFYSPDMGFRPVNDTGADPIPKCHVIAITLSTKSIDSVKDWLLYIAHYLQSGE
ncbi:hypothetical protein HDU92_004438 [Lobulomyces angularis]|nr:hypothetical protein HDU92_004438 [Lobulomyces angularis]